MKTFKNIKKQQKRIDEIIAGLQISLEPPVPLSVENQMTVMRNDFTNDIEFDIKFWGYDRQQTDHYIDKITEDYNAICEKCAALEEENKGLRRALAGINREPEVTA